LAGSAGDERWGIRRAVVWGLSQPVQLSARGEKLYMIKDKSRAAWHSVCWKNTVRGWVLRAAIKN